VLLGIRSLLLEATLSTGLALFVILVGLVNISWAVLELLKRHK